MSMNWAIQSQMRMQQVGIASALMARRLCERYIQFRRAQGDRRFISCGATPQSLEGAIGALNQEYDNYNRAMEQDSRITTNAEDNYDWGAVRGCERVWNAYLQRWYPVCP